MLINTFLLDRGRKTNAVSTYIKGLGWVAGESILYLPDMELKFSIVNRLDIYNIINKFNVPYLTKTIKHGDYFKDQVTVEKVFFNIATDEELNSYHELFKILKSYHDVNGYYKSSPVNKERLIHLTNLLGLHGLTKDVLADEIILTLKNNEENFIKTYQVTDYLENYSCEHPSNKVCLNHARSFMIGELSKDLVDLIITSDYKANIDAKMELEVEASMVTLSGEKEFTRITKFAIDEGFLSELLQYATKYNEVLDEDSKEDPEIESPVVNA